LSLQNDLTYIRQVFIGTADGLYALLTSLAYLLAGLVLSLGLVSRPEGVRGDFDIAGLWVMPILLMLVHLWHRSGITLEKKLHLPSIVGVSAFAVLVPLIRLGVF
jgi:hypothetical protein